MRSGVCLSIKTQSRAHGGGGLTLQTKHKAKKIKLCILSDPHNFHSLPPSRSSVVISRYGGGKE